MARMISTTIRLNEEDVRALKRARAAGHSASELVRKGLRVVADTPAIAATKQALFSLTGELNRFL